MGVEMDVDMDGDMCVDMDAGGGAGTWGKRTYKSVLEVSVSEVSVSEKNRGLFCLPFWDEAMDVGTGVDVGGVGGVDVDACVDVGIDTHRLDDPL